MKTVSAAEANRQFSAVLREVAAGNTVLVTSRGKPVAKIEPAAPTPGPQSRAKRRLLEHLRRVEPVGRRDWQRDELYP
ncbi:MAG: type II toxin-antitoxin system prevent-host-death family antitoxin [Burkholderiales bacterium]|nr:type II toxin-antitoxin system prevent-host-death family antitoxin [Burkholderiales bacterium]